MSSYTPFYWFDKQGQLVINKKAMRERAKRKPKPKKIVEQVAEGMYDPSTKAFI